MLFSLVSTVFNEKQRLTQTIQDLEAQTVQPAEIVITDAGSTDGTYEALLDWSKKSSIKIVVLHEAKCNVARGRNLAIAAAGHNLIVSTDFGCRFHPKWLEILTTPFADPTVKVVGGGYSVLEEEITTKAARAAYLLSYGYQINFDKWFIPSSRSIAYYKEVWENVGKYPEWLTLAGDDYFFGLEIVAKGYGIFIQKDPLVYWGRHTTSIGYEKEAFRYGLGNGEARINPKSILVIIGEWGFRALFMIFTIFSLVWPYYIFLLILSLFFGFRSYFGITKFWFNIRSRKYSFKILIYAYVLLEKTE